VATKKSLQNHYNLLGDEENWGSWELEKGKDRDTCKVYTPIIEDARYTENDIVLFSKIPVKTGFDKFRGQRVHDAMVSEVKSILRKVLIDRPKNATTCIVLD